MIPIKDNYKFGMDLTMIPIKDIWLSVLIK